LLSVLLLNALSAIGGGVALMTGWIPDQPSWVEHTDFASLYFPGVILMAVVGGSALVAALALATRSEAWQLASLVSGVVMIIWIIGEIASIHAFHWLQVVYLATGAVVIWWTPQASEPGRPRAATEQPRATRR
jgi:hypothetical protein